MKLSTLILEARNRPKIVVMAGGAGTGKSYLLNQLDLGSLPLVNPDKYVEDPKSPAYNKLTSGVALANKEADQLTDDKTSFVWDTTASNPKKVKDIINKGYDVYMVMVYTHPMIAYIANAGRKRQVPSSAVFSTWRNVYQLIKDYQKMTGGNMSIFINDRGGQYKDEVEGFDTAAKNGVQGIKDYLQNYNNKNDIGGSSFFVPVEMSKQEEEEFLKATANIDYNKDNRSEDKALKKVFLKAYQANGVGPGEDKLRDAVKKYRAEKEKTSERENDILENIAEMLYSPTFQAILQHSTPAEIDQNIQNFLS